MTTHKVTKRKDHYYLDTNGELLIYRYPEGDCDAPIDAEKMLGALYDEHNAHDDLFADGDTIETPHGAFKVEGVHVSPLKVAEPAFVTSARHVLEHGVAVVDGETGELKPELSFDYAPNEETFEEELVIVTKEGEHVEGYALLDIQTANMLVMVWEACTETNRAKFAACKLAKAVAVGWSCIR